MLDLSYFQNINSNTQLFQNGGTWQTWIKPRGAKIVNFFVVGAGAGGGGGFQAAAGSISGGGSGGAGGYIKLTIQASILPDILYILPGTGGIGGTGGVSPKSGSTATKSYVCLIPDISSISNIICTSGAVAATGGGAGSTIAATAGVGETIVTITNTVFVNLGTFLSNSGLGGLAGQLTTGAVNSVTSFLVTGGGGGGTGAGGAAPSSVGGPFPILAGGAINTNGRNGLIFYKPLFGVTGGTGGGGGTNGGVGGNGAPGCGGGGGGAGTSSAGNGGRGGDGFIIITTNF